MPTLLAQSLLAQLSPNGFNAPFPGFSDPFGGFPMSNPSFGFGGLYGPPNGLFEGLPVSNPSASSGGLNGFLGGTTPNLTGSPSSVGSPLPSPPVTGGGPSARSQPYEDIIAEASRTYGVPVNHIRTVIKHESDFNPRDRSHVGAAGLMQLMPETARSLGVTNVYDPRQNIMGGTKYLAQMYKQFGSWPLAFAAYNAGPGNVRKYGGIPPFKETQVYVNRILNTLGFR